MRSTSSSSTPKYAADLDNVREVTLHGTADLSFWEAVLHKERLIPYHQEDKAVLLLSAIDAKWRGFRLREFVIAVGVCLNENEAKLDAIIYHTLSIRPNSWLSRKGCFSDPLFQGDIQLDSKFPASIKLRDKAEVLFNAEMSVQDTGPIIEYQEWKGPVFLPNNRGKFFAILAGDTESYPFSPATDQLEFTPSARHRIFQQLIESNFTGKTWSLRNHSRHAKVKDLQTRF